MVKHSLLNGFSNTLVQIEPYDVNPELSDDIQQSLSRLIAWDYDEQIWKPVASDNDGRILVSSSPTQSNIAVNSAATVALSSVLLLQENSSRRQYIIQNLGATAIYIYFGTPANASLGLQIPANGVFTDDVYTGVVTAIALSGSNDVRVVEV